MIALLQPCCLVMTVALVVVQEVMMTGYAYEILLWQCDLLAHAPFVGLTSLDQRVQ